MTSALVGGLVGLALGMRHALEPDHLAAVGTFVSENATPRSAAIMGALWGTGHASAVMILGGGMLGLGVRVPQQIEPAAELLVGAILVWLGLRALRAGWRSRSSLTIEYHHHALSGASPFAIGLAHGVAGTGAATILATASVGGALGGWTFLGVFGVGSIVGMAAVASALSLPLRRVAHSPKTRGSLFIATGSVSLLVGLWWISR